jgi:hypothetical protein
MRRGVRICAAAGMLALLLGGWTLGASAGRTREFRVENLHDVLAGELDGVAVGPEGALQPGPVAERLFADEAAYVWALQPDGHGGVYAATGSQGRLYHIDAEGRWTQLAQTFEYELFALAREAGGALVTAGAPNGTVTRVTTAGETETLVDLPEGLVWNLLAAPRGDLYMSTGESGEIYRIDRQGKTTRVGSIPDLHAISLAWWGQRILCGTDGRGLLAALDPQSGAVEILYDTEQEEVPAVLARDDERVVFAANGEGSARGTSDSGNALMLSPIEVRPGNSSGGGAVLYELGPEGWVRPLWRCPEQQILALATAPDGNILVATGGDGALYEVAETGEATRLLELDEAQVLSLLVSQKRVFLGTGNGGSVYRFEWDAPRGGTYTSRVWDAGAVALWGAPAWVATGQGSAALETRSGQLAETGPTWSDWAGLEGGKIASPPGRYLQWRLQLSGPAAGGLRLREIRIPYRGPNLPPRVTGARVSAKGGPLHADGAGGRPPAVRQSLGGGVEVEYSLDDQGGGSAEHGESRAGLWARSLRTAIWKAEDPDGDELRYDLFLRPAGEPSLLALKRDLDRTAYTWDATAWPEGWYELVIVASDARDNPPGEGLTGRAVSAPFQIDNTPPQLRDARAELEGGQWVVAGRAVDALGRIAGLEISVNGEAWRPADPLDGIFDAADESFRLAVPPTEDGSAPSVAGIRASDEVGNTAVVQLRLDRRP